MALEVVKTLLRFGSISNYAVKFVKCSTPIEFIDLKRNLNVSNRSIANH